MATKAKQSVVEVFEIVANSALAEASKKASPLVPQSVVDLVAVGKIAELYSDGEKDIEAGEIKIKRSAGFLAELLGTNPTYAEWHDVRKAWVNAYQALKPKITAESCERAFNRLADVMRTEFELERPSKNEGNAVVMSERRAKEKAHLESLVDSQLLEAVAGFVQIGNYKEAAKYQGEVKRREKLAGKDAEAELKHERKILSRCIWKITDASRIAEIRALIPNAVYDEVVADMIKNTPVVATAS